MSITSETPKLPDDFGLDMENRDPESLNVHVRVLFEDVLAEPLGAHSPEGIWRCVFKMFICSKDMCYKILSYLCAVPAAICWGCNFACVSFSHVYAITPCLKAYVMNIGACKMIYGATVRMCCDPCYEACGRMLSDIRVTHVNE
ncbi:caveolin-3-like [Saccoglossus kowalevskii]|uniref:Caveolin n=1 Tax=Saccoglossus kowalevskii TaxID=10224 RepID=A0ABM0GVP4_SACKO|nr:PREDICTED: caveolin-3-like [Saccoglossus kowalevskii]